LRSEKVVEVGCCDEVRLLRMQARSVMWRGRKSELKDTFGRVMLERREVEVGPSCIYVLANLV